MTTVRYPLPHGGGGERANTDAKSPAYNNEKAFWDCADEVLRQAAATGNGTTTGNGAAPRTPAPDPRSSNDYTLVTAARQQDCGTRYPDSPKDDKGYNDCVDQALMDTLEELEDGPGDPTTDANSGNTAGQAADPRATKDYSSLPMGYLSTCAQDYGEDSSPYFDCLDAGVESEAINLRVENEFSDITPEEIDGCTTYGYGSDDFFTCLFAVRDNKASQGQAVDTSGDTSGRQTKGRQTSNCWIRR